jgi:hypothetical protein
MSKCTKEYNDETKRLMREAEVLKQLARDAENGDFGPSMRAKAREITATGEKDPMKVTEQVHKFINEYAPHEKSEVVQSLLERRAPSTPDENRARHAEMLAEMRGLEEIQKTMQGERPGEETANKAERTRVTNQIKDLDRRIANRDESRPKDTSQHHQWDAETQKLRDMRDETKAQLDKLEAPQKQEAAKVKRLQDDVAKLDEQLAGAEQKAKGKLEGPETQEVTRLREEKAAKQKQLAEMRGPSDAKNEARLRQLKRDIAELERQHREKDYPKKNAKGEVNWSEEVKKEQIRRRNLEQVVEREIEKAERLGGSKYKRTLGLLHDTHLFNIFTSGLVHLKLGAAVLGGHAHAFTSRGAVSLARLIPALNEIALKSQTHGAGLTKEGFKARYGGETWAGTLRAMKEVMQHGASKLELAYGDPHQASDAHLAHIGTLSDALKTDGRLNQASEVFRWAASMPARTHGLVKQMLAHPEFWNSVADQRNLIQQRLKAANWSDEAIQKHLNLESTQDAIHTKAMADAYESKMQGKNKWNDQLVGLIGALEKKDTPFNNTLSFVLRSILPVARVGPNVFKQGTSLLFGGLKALHEAKFGKDAHGGREMTPERADYIMKNIGAQGTGIAMAMIGAIFHDQLGGIEGTEKKGEEGEVKPGEAHVGGLDVGKLAFHGAPTAMLQMGASLVKVFQEEQKGKSSSNAIDATLNALGSGGVALGSTAGNWAERTLPYTDQARRIYNTVRYGREGGRAGNPWEEVAGNQLRSMLVPTGLQQYAAWQDPEKGFPKSKSIAQDIESGLPGQSFLGIPGRESLPHKAPKGEAKGGGGKQMSSEEYRAQLARNRR